MLREECAGPGAKKILPEKLKKLDRGFATACCSLIAQALRWHPAEMPRRQQITRSQNLCAADAS